MRYAGPDGRMRFESSQSATFKVAQGLLLQRKHAVMDGTDPLPARSLPSYSFTDLAAQYAAWAARQRAFHTSKKFLLSQLHAFFGSCPLQSVTTRLVEDYQTTLLTQGKAPATVNRHLATLKHMFTKAVEWEMGTEEMLKRVRRVKLLPENNRRLRYLSLEECQALLTACPPHLQPIVLTALHTGMRREEILSLQWAQHVDLRHGFFLLDKTKSGERREIPINTAVRQTLQGLVQFHARW
jgi:integrase